VTTATPLPDLATAINNAIAPIYHTAINLVAYPAQGDFPWWYQNPNGVFNQLTFDYLSARVSSSGASGTVQLSPSGGFPNAYVQVVNNLIYTLSSADQQTLASALSTASAEAETIVSDYQTTFGPITPAQMTTAAVSTKLDYVVSYVLGAVWSGRASAGQAPLTYSQMAAAANLLDLLPAMPAAGAQVVADAAAYLRLMAPTNALQSKVQLGAWIAAQLRANTSAPTAANGGIQTVDPNSGNVGPGFQVGYGINRALGDIQADLNNAERVLSVEVAAPSAGPPALRFAGADRAAGAVLPLASVNSAQSITIDYPGYTMVPVAATAWQQATNNGWFYADPIAEAAANGSGDVTGFKFVTSPPYNLGDLAAGGNLGQLTALLISNYPTVKVSAPQAAAAALANVAVEGANGGLSLFGIPVGDPSRVTYRPVYSEGSAATAVELTFVPSVAQVPTMQQTAYVIGAVVDFPATQVVPLSAVARLLAGTAVNGRANRDSGGDVPG
jgi:hypothetical protein